MTKGINFIFGKHAPRKSPVMTPETFFRKGAWPGSRDPLNFWALNANSSKTTKDANFKFGTSNLSCMPQVKPDMIPENNFEQGAWLGSRDP